MSLKKRIISAVTAAVMAITAALGFSGCSSQVNYAMEIDGEKIPAGLYILYTGLAVQEAQQKLAEEQPNLDTSAKDFDYFAQKVSDMDFLEYVRQDALKLCKRHSAVNKLYDQLKITETEDEKKELTETLNSQWDFEVPDWISTSMEYIKGFKTVGDYYLSIGVAKSSLKTYIWDNFKASKIFNYYYGEGGIEEVSKSDKEKYLDENYALCRYIAVPITDKSGKVIESKTELALLEKLCNEYAQKLNNGESFKDVYNEYVEYSKSQEALTATTTAPKKTEAKTTAADGSQQGRDAQPVEPQPTTAASESTPVEAATASENTTTANSQEPQPTEATTASSEETTPVEITTAADKTTSAAAAKTDKETGTGTAASTTGPKDSDYNRVINKKDTSPSEEFVSSLFAQAKNTAMVFKADSYYYVVSKLDILTDEADYLKQYDGAILDGLKGDEMDAVIEKEYSAYTIVDNKAAPDYCKQQAQNAFNALNAVAKIQYLIYYYSSAFGGLSQ